MHAFNFTLLILLIKLARKEFAKFNGKVNDLEMMAMRLDSAAQQDNSKQEKARECGEKVSGLIRNEGGDKGDKVKILLKMMELESLIKMDKVLHMRTCLVHGEVTSNVKIT